MTVELRQLQGSTTWEAKVIDPSDGYVLQVFWGSQKRVVKRAEKFIKKWSHAT